MDEVNIKKHNTASTSSEAFKALTREGTLAAQKKIIYESIRTYGPATSRRLAQLTRQERSSVCRSLFDLLNEISPVVKVAFIDKCPITGKRVKHYSMIDWQPQQKNNSVQQLSLYE